MTIWLDIIGADIIGSDQARIFAQDLPGITVQVVCNASAPCAKVMADAVGAVDVMSAGEVAIVRRITPGGWRVRRPARDRLADR